MDTSEAVVVDGHYSGDFLFFEGDEYGWGGFEVNVVDVYHIRLESFEVVDDFSVGMAVEDGFEKEGDFGERLVVEIGKFAKLDFVAVLF